MCETIMKCNGCDVIVAKAFSPVLCVCSRKQTIKTYAWCEKCVEAKEQAAAEAALENADPSDLRSDCHD